MEKEKPDKKEHILEVAERIFSELGYDGASTRNISAEAGVNMAMINYYFGSKEGLFKAVFERRITDFRAMLQGLSIEDISSWEKLEKCIDYYIDRTAANNHFHKLMQRELSLSQRSGITETIVELLLSSVLEVKKIVKEGVQNGSFKADVDVEMLIATLFGTKYYIFNSPQMSSAVLEVDVEVEKIREDVIKPRAKAHLKNLFKSYLINENH